MNLGDCQPLQCEKAMAAIEGVRDPASTPLDIAHYRSQLADCPPCLSALELEARLRVTMTPTVSELPTVDFRMRITQTLASIDLGDLDITDF